ncbi:unnamed protein product, partial [Bubo scandiacus]
PFYFNVSTIVFQWRVTTMGRVFRSVWSAVALLPRLHRQACLTGRGRADRGVGTFSCPASGMREPGWDVGRDMVAPVLELSCRAVAHQRGSSLGDGEWAQPHPAAIEPVLLTSITCQSKTQLCKVLAN